MKKQPKRWLSSRGIGPVTMPGKRRSWVSSEREEMEAGSGILHDIRAVTLSRARVGSYYAKFSFKVAKLRLILVQPKCGPLSIISPPLAIGILGWRWIQSLIYPVVFYSEVPGGEKVGARKIGDTVLDGAKGGNVGGVHGALLKRLWEQSEEEEEKAKRRGVGVSVGPRRVRGGFQVCLVCPKT
ncbi:hypothetical protein CRG98_027403 [Punica granatum]|uniref:Uncharacterized protein n=1 Tax=Punica granatum TaxID=22663 RepID=A0A2I0J7M1_PUNGR|nr:hypothetical protein CRG98_027403 [Punica granatum]